MPESGIILVVPETELLVGQLRSRYDRVAALGVPAHITLLYPWVVPPVSAAVIERLRVAVAGVRSYSLTFRGIGRFEAALYLRPDDDGQTVDLMSRLARAFPEYPPYGGRFVEQVPHLTVAETPDIEPVIQDHAARLLGGLPLVAAVRAVTIMESDQSDRWSAVAELPLA